MLHKVVAVLITAAYLLAPKPEPQPELPPPPPPVVEEVAYPVSVPIIIYHHLAPPNLNIPYNDEIITPTQFENQIKLLKDMGYSSVTVSELYEMLKLGKMPQEKIFAITFDDGYESNYIYAFPILKKYNMKATINVVVKTIQEESTPQFDPEVLSHLSWEQMREMLDSGLIEFGSHTYNQHIYEVTDNKKTAPALTNRVYLYKEQTFESDEEWKKRIFDDLLLAKAKMEHKLGYSPKVIAYPYGDYNQAVIEIVKEVGYEIGLTTNLGLATSESPIFELPRTYIRPYDDMADFFFKIKNISPEG
ncbi:MAG: polysaccharide deacetylase family protein [Clostridia bacterium]|nr:polysaccharide deacetylase family protein [Clostridia bacterium]